MNKLLAIKRLKVLLRNQEAEAENDKTSDYEKSFAEEALNDMSSTETENFSNGLENFGVEGETAPDLFTSETETIENEGLLSEENTENDHENDDLEIPAFLRRQKN